jgi:hypothetical protein
MPFFQLILLQLLVYPLAMIVITVVSMFTQFMFRLRLKSAKIATTNDGAMPISQDNDIMINNNDQILYEKT